MADLSDVTDALVAIVAAAVYPNGTSQPPATGYPTKVFGGWPISTSLDADLRAGAVNISVFPQSEMEKVTTRYPREWQDQTRVQPSIVASIADHAITLSGQIVANDYLAIFVKGGIYAYKVLANDTLATVATAIAALINVDMPASSAGAVITVPATAAGRISARAAAPGTLIRELRRQQRGYQITVWAASPAARAATCKTIDPALTLLDSLAMPDGSMTWITYRHSGDFDGREANHIFRRDIFFSVEFATTEVMVGYPITAFPASTTLYPPGTPGFTAS